MKTSLAAFLVLLPSSCGLSFDNKTNLAKGLGEDVLHRMLTAQQMMIQADSIIAKSLFDKAVKEYLTAEYADAKRTLSAIDQPTEVVTKYLLKIDSIETSMRIKRILENEAKFQLIRKELKGNAYKYPWSLKVIDKYGTPVTLRGTNNFEWFGYFPKGDFSIQLNKSNDLIIEVFKSKIYEDAW